MLLNMHKISCTTQYLIIMHCSKNFPQKLSDSNGFDYS